MPSSAKTPSKETNAFGAAAGGALVGAIAGGLFSLWASWWLVSIKNDQESQAAACVLGGELQMTHTALLRIAKAGKTGQPDKVLEAVAYVRQMNINPPPETWALAVKLKPSLASEISKFRASFTSSLNSVSYGIDHPDTASMDTDTLAKSFTDWAGVSGSFAKTLITICDKGPAYEPSPEERKFRLKLN